MNQFLYNSPLGPMLCQEEENHLLFLDFTDNTEVSSRPTTDVLMVVRDWLNAYFHGEKVESKSIPVQFSGTPFQNCVWELLLEIPYGETTTYGALAKQVAEKIGKKTMSAQAIGGAVGRNPISIIVPCHRVVGAKGQLTGYAGGLDKKAFLLALEQGE